MQDFPDKIVWRIVLVDKSDNFCFANSANYETKDEADRAATQVLHQREYVLLPFFRKSDVYARTHIIDIRTSYGRAYIVPRLESASKKNMEKAELDKVDAQKIADSMQKRAAHIIKEEREKQLKNEVRLQRLRRVMMAQLLLYPAVMAFVLYITW